MISSPKILILKMSALGDVVHALPVLETLRANHPGAFIAWMIEERFKCLIENHPALDEAIPVNTKRWRREINLNSLKEAFKAFRKIRKEKFDIVLDLHGLIKSGIISYASGSPKRIGFSAKDCKETVSAIFNNQRAAINDPDCHVVSANLKALQTAVPCKDIRYDFSLPADIEAEEKAERFIQSLALPTGKSIVALNPGAGFESKRWPLEKFSILADALTSQFDVAVLLTWGPGEEKMVQQIADSMKGNYLLAPQTTIVESISLYRRIALFIGSDSGPLHLSAALGIPCIALFGPTNPARNGPYGEHAQAIYKKLSCSFCWKRSCPLGTKECMNSIEVDGILSRARDILMTSKKPDQ